MSKHRNPRSKCSLNYTIDDLRRAAAGGVIEILMAAGVPSDALDGRRGRPCPRCGGVDRFSIMPENDERGAVTAVPMSASVPKGVCGANTTQSTLPMEGL